MIYFDNAATTLQKPPCVAEAVVQAMTTLGNCGRGACANMAIISLLKPTFSVDAISLIFPSCNLGVKGLKPA